MNPIIVDNLSKSYQEVKALKSISFSVEDGELFGVIGPDGAGKTSLFRILTTLLIPDTGTAKMLGMDVVKDYKKIRNILGYMPGKFSLYQDLSVEENLEFFAGAFGVTIKENYDLIKDIYIQIEPFKNRLAGKLSGGMKQKLALSCALIHRPEILVLDEPTTGVDAVSRKEFWGMLKNLKKEGITIIVSTPYMDEASLCDRVSLIQNGEILETNKPEEIVNGFKKRMLSVSADNKYLLLRELQKYHNTYSVYPFGDYFHFIPKDASLKKEDLRSYLISKELDNVDVVEETPNIEDVFIELMSKNDSNE